ncbi:hypothetical protein GGX14DRAFT_557813 [Mycena pura]|uniref:DUF6729 domain-containing protein n=1 Tax=Mycena pura TaxID=153505 RepID=A0AAD6YLV9_9AGAR|nr:hypothetical protein GGX14DRAFT_557813 [Mycena pura]
MEPKPRGRPRGTGPKQLEQAVAGNDKPVQKRPVGRPPKLAPPKRTDVRLGKHTVRGTPAVLRSQLPGTVNPLHSIFNPQPAATSSRSPSTIVPPSVDTSTKTDPPMADEGQQDGEEDGTDGLLNDGVGEEDEGSDDEEQDGEAPEDRPTPPSSQPRHKLPGWLQSQFDKKLMLAGIRDKGVPLLYSRDKTFWFPIEDPYFALQHPESLSPQKMFQARFFLWDPDVLLGGARIPCLICRTGLNRLCPIPRPRRCVDLDSNFWIIGYRYHCPNCAHPKSGRKTVTFRSWDPRIIQNLPQSLADSFPVRLTHRSGISNSLFMFMRSCFQSGMGAKQFSDALRVRHLEYYDTLQIKYLSALAKQKDMNKWLGTKYRSFLPFEDTSPDGYHGFVPSSQWLRDLYDKFIEDHEHDFNQAIALLTALICHKGHQKGYPESGF